MSTSKPTDVTVEHKQRAYNLRHGIKPASPKQQAYRFFYANAGSSHTPGKLILFQ